MSSYLNEDMRFRLSQPYGYINMGYNTSFLSKLAVFAAYDNSLCGPANYWTASNLINAANISTHFASQPYGFYNNFRGRSHYVVLDPFQYSYEGAMGAHGYRNGYSVEQLLAQSQAITDRIVLEGQVKNTIGYAGKTLQGVANFAAAYKEHEAIKGDSALVSDLQQLEAKAKTALEQLEKATVDEKGNPKALEEVKAIMSVYKETASALDSSAKSLGTRVDAAIETYNKQQADAAAASTQRGLDEAAADASKAAAVANGASGVATTAGDTELKTNDALSKEYGVKQPVIASKMDVDAAVRELKAHTKNDDDAKDYQYLKALFSSSGTNGSVAVAQKIDSKNIVEVLDEVLGSYNLYDGIYEMDNSREIFNLFTDTLKKRIKLVEDAGYLTQTEADKLRKILSGVDSAVGVDKDIPSDEPKYDGQKVSSCLQDVVNGLKNVGTQADFDKKVKAAKEKRTKEATKKFVSDYATTLGSGKKAKSDAKLPAGVTYLPNSKMYQWKSGDKVYKAATFAELKQAIVNTGDTVLIAQFQKDVLDKMTTQVQ